MIKIGLRSSVLCLLISIILHNSTAKEWRGWRGNTRNGQVSGVDWPERLTSFDTGESNLQKLWRVELGPSYSGPIVSEELVFATETTNKKKEIVHALDRKSGKTVWKTHWIGSMKVPFFAVRNGSWIRSTPAYDGERLYVAGMRDVLVCLDVKSGQKLWVKDFMGELGTPLPRFGFVCSPLVNGQDLYVQAGASFAKLDKVTGEIQWRTLIDGGGMYGSAFSSPYMVGWEDQNQVIVQTRTRLAGVDSTDGQVHWSVEIPAFRGMNILTPTVDQNRIFTSTYRGGSFAFKVVSEAGKWRVEKTWDDPAQGYMSSPVIVDDHVYLHLRNQRLACFNLETGDKQWTSRQRFGQYMSLVTKDRKILALDERGILLLFRANPDQFEQIDQVRISEQPTWGHLAICGNEIFIRELQAISAYRWDGSTEVMDANNQEPYWDGVLDELSLWHKTLKAQEVKWAMDGTIFDESGTSVDPVGKLTTTWGQLKLTN